MPKIETAIPEKLRPYLFHGISLNWDVHQAIGDCPWCGREGKFAVEVMSGKWVCRVCRDGGKNGGGNIYTFLRNLWAASDKDTTDYRDLATDRGIAPDTLIHWGMARSMMTGDWLIPGYNAKGSLCQLYRMVQRSDRSLLLPTPGLGHQIHGISPLVKKESTVYVCEGPWDAMSLWECLGQCKQTDGVLTATASVEHSLLADAAVLAVPGCSTFMESWLPLFEGRDVVLMYDNDHPRKHPKTGKPIAPAYREGMQRAAGMLVKVAKSVKILAWGGAMDYDPSLPSGYDLRDALVKSEGSVPAKLSWILDRVQPMPESWSRMNGHRANGKHHKSSRSMELLDCNDYKTLVTSWRKAMRWTDGLDHALACTLAVITSTPMIGDQLWMKVLGPAACGKSTICEAVSVNHDYVLAKSTIRGFHSGFKEKGGIEAGEDNSLIAMLPGKTLVTKDGDTLLQSPNLPQILSEGRDIYDGTSRTHYRNAMSQDYDGLRVTWVLYGTSSLRLIDSSELGERFLDCVIMDSIDDDLEDEILDRVVHRAARDVATESDGEVSKHYAAEMAQAMRLTGGYVEWLRNQGADGLSQVVYPIEAKRMLTRLGKFTAFMRARPSTRQEEIAEREFATRLVSQLTRLAGCLAVVLNRKEVDAEVMKRVRQVAMDTSRGRTLAIISHLYDAEDGLDSRTLGMLGGQTEDKVRVLLRFLRAIGAVESFQPESKKTRVHWRLTPKLTRLYYEVKEI